ncbi:MAG: hypothetical protein JW987_07065 [Anaerolineaceae bacterium]|nr:hypothetical protein [Anaerolineaceae bacterium]
MKAIKKRWPLFLAFGLLTLGGLFFLLRPVPSGKSATPKQAILPSEGWVVCADLGIGSPPGAPGNVQLMLLCAGNDWEVRAFCLEPAEPAPPLGAGCSLVGGNTFWCGEQYQLLQLYQIQQTPAPTATPTRTPTATNTPLPTNTPVPSATPVPSVTPLPSLTPQQPAATVQPSATPAPDTQPTVFVRPSAGGPGNLLPVASVLAVAAGLALLVAARRR